MISSYVSVELLNSIASYKNNELHFIYIGEPSVLSGRFPEFDICWNIRKCLIMWTAQKYLLIFINTGTYIPGLFTSPSELLLVNVKRIGCLCKDFK